jgi:hypothetical protein
LGRLSFLNLLIKTLKDAKNYIKENKYLPDVPSTAVVNRDEIDLAQTQVSLL